MLVISLIYSCLVLASVKTRHWSDTVSFHLFLFMAGSVLGDQCVSNTCNKGCLVCCVARTVSEQQSPKLEVSEYER